MHYVQSLTADQVTKRDGLPVTTITRTLLDLAAVLEPRNLEMALESALRAGLVTVDDIAEEHRRTARTTAGKGIVGVLLERRSTIISESPLEVVVLATLREGGLPEPALQYEVFDQHGSFVGRPDIAYPDVRLAIEADGYRFHSTAKDWMRDRARQNALIRLGWTVYRVTWEDVTMRPHVIVEDVSELLAALHRRALSEARSSRSG